MNLIDLVFFLINITIGYFVGKYFWSHFGFIYAPFGFLLGFFAFIGLLKFLEILSSLWNKIFPKAKK